MPHRRPATWRRLPGGRAPESSRRASMAGTSDRWVTGCCARDAATVSAAKPSCSRTPAPARAQRQRMDRPPMWWSGRQSSHRSPGSQRQVVVRGAGRGIEIGVAQHDAARFALAAAGCNDEGDAGRQGLVCDPCGAVDRLERAIFQAAGEGVAGQVETAAGSDQRVARSVDGRRQRRCFGQPCRYVQCRSGRARRALRPARCGVGKMAGKRRDGFHRMRL